METCEDYAQMPLDLSNTDDELSLGDATDAILQGNFWFLTYSQLFLFRYV